MYCRCFQVCCTLLSAFHLSVSLSVAPVSLGTSARREEVPLSRSLARPPGHHTLSTMHVVSSTTLFPLLTIKYSCLYLFILLFQCFTCDRFATLYRKSLL